MPGRPMSTLKDKKLIHLFSTPIMEYRWEDSDDLNRRLTDVILEKERASGGKVMSNVGGWHSEANFEQWAGDAGQELIHRVGTLVNHATREYYKLYGGKEAIRWRLTLWANVNRDGDFNQGHIHPGATWSGVYYVDAGAPSADRNDNGVLALAHTGRRGRDGVLSGDHASPPRHRAAVRAHGSVSELLVPPGLPLLGGPAAYLHRLQHQARKDHLIVPIIAHAGRSDKHRPGWRLLPRQWHPPAGRGRRPRPGRTTGSGCGSCCARSWSWPWSSSAA